MLMRGAMPGTLRSAESYSGSRSSSGGGSYGGAVPIVQVYLGNELATNHVKVVVDGRLREQSKTVAAGSRH